MLHSRFAKIICLSSCVLNILAIFGFIIALVRIGATPALGWLLAAGLSCVYVVLPGRYLAHTFGIPVPATGGPRIILNVLSVVSAVFIVLGAMVLLGVVGAHDVDFPGASLTAALLFAAAFAFLPFWYFFTLLFDRKPAR